MANILTKTSFYFHFLLTVTIRLPINIAFKVTSKVIYLSQYLFSLSFRAKIVHWSACELNSWERGLCSDSAHVAFISGHFDESFHSPGGAPAAKIK